MTDTPPPRSTQFATLFFLLCFFLVAFLLYLVFRPFFSIFIWACILAVVFQPLFRAMLRAMRGHRTAASLVTCITVLLLIVLPVSYLGIVLSRQTIAFYHGLQTSVGPGESEAAARFQELQKDPRLQWVFNRLGALLGSESIDLQGIAQPVLQAISRFLIARGPTLLASVGSMLYGFLMVFITMFFLLRDGPKVVEFVRASNPLPPHYESEIIQKFQDVSYATFFGSILTAVVQGSAATLLFWALGINSPLFWGAVVSFVALVPIVGAFLVWIPMSAHLLLLGNTTKGIVLLAVGGLVVSSIDNVLKPMIIQGRTDMHPLLVFLSVLGGMQAFGFLGILLGPLTVAIFLSFLNFYRHQFRESLQNKVSPNP